MDRVRLAVVLPCIAMLLIAAECGAVVELKGKSRSIPQSYVTIARTHGVPPKVLYSVALVESGKRLPTGQYRPYPWTLNIQGKPARFSGSKETVESLRRAMHQGITSVDVGLLQTNMHWHGRRFPSIWKAVDPWANASAGASILAEEYKRCALKEWWCAVGRYHSYRPELARNYAEKVKKYYSQLLEPQSS